MKEDEDKKPKDKNELLIESIKKRIDDVIIEQLDIKDEDENQVTKDAHFIDDLGADSLDLVELILAFEEEFEDIIEDQIPEEDAEELDTVGKVYDYIIDKAKKAGKFD